MHQPSPASGTIDPAELAKFERMATEWWRADGKFKPLHDLNPVRIGFIRDHVCGHFERGPREPRPFSGLRMVDIGCGGGILTEPMARLGAEIVGIDPAAGNVEVARIHAQKAGLEIDYRAVAAEDLVAGGEQFDVVLAMEVVEHVSDLQSFLALCATLVRPGGLLFVSTINRTLRSFALAIVTAEYVLRWLPRGTHDYSKLIRPAELQHAMAAAGLVLRAQSGVVFNPLTRTWSRSSDTSVNYMVCAEKPPELS